MTDPNTDPNTDPMMPVVSGNKHVSHPSTCQHKWDAGVRTEGVIGGYTFTCALCGSTQTGHRQYIPMNTPLTHKRMSKKQRLKERRGER